MIGRDQAVLFVGSHDRSPQWVPKATSTRGPTDEHIVPAQIGKQQGGGVRIALRHRVTRRAISRGLPRVEKHPARHGRRSPPSEETNLIGVGGSIEIATQNASRRLAFPLCHELDDCSDLLLTIFAPGRIRGQVRHYGEQLPAGPIDHRPERDVGMVDTGRDREWSGLDVSKRPPAQQCDTLIDAAFYAVARKSVNHPQLFRQQGSLVKITLLPDLLQADKIRAEFHQCLGNCFGASLPVAEPPPEIPRHYADLRLDQRAVGRRRISSKWMGPRSAPP